MSNRIAHLTLRLLRQYTDATYGAHRNPTILGIQLKSDYGAHQICWSLHGYRSAPNPTYGHASPWLYIAEVVKLRRKGLVAPALPGVVVN